MPRDARYDAPAGFCSGGLLGRVYNVSGKRLSDRDLAFLTVVLAACYKPGLPVLGASAGSAPRSQAVFEPGSRVTVPSIVPGKNP